jgi:hypothetical protein
VNTGTAKEKTDEQSGPNVTDWFAYDLVLHMKHRVENNSLGGYGHQAADLMTHKWIDFGGPDKGRGVNTVRLGKTVFTKNQLGNFALLFIGRIWPPSDVGDVLAGISVSERVSPKLKVLWQKVFADPESLVDDATQTIIARNKALIGKDRVESTAILGYSIIPNHKKDYFGKWSDKFLWRADNLAVFGAAVEVADRFLKKIDPNLNEARKKVDKLVMDQEGRKKLEKAVREALDEVFGGSEAANKVLGEAVKRFAHLQPSPVSGKIGIGALTFTPNHGGFDTNSLEDPKGEGFKGAPSIAVATLIKNKYEEYRKAGGKMTLAQWRVAEYEDYTKRSGITPR